jgi:predicted nucleic acid-binding protein
LSNIKEISTFVPKKDNTFLFDTNVLIKIFYPALGAKNSAPYIKLYQSIRSSKATLLISSIQISEFVNRCIRFQFDLYKKSHPEVTQFKEHYRETDDYTDYMNAILEIIENDILNNFIKTNDNFENMSNEKLFMHSFSYDFNDAIIAEISRMRKSILVTDDSDYINYLGGIDIVTNNKSLLLFSNNR